METTTPSAFVVTDWRKESHQTKNPLRFDGEAVEIAAAVVGLEITLGMVIQVRIIDQSDDGDQGSTEQVGPNAYRITIAIANKAHFEDRHLYIANNSLLHELRIIALAQMLGDQAEAIFGSELGAKSAAIDARLHARLADHTGEKETGHAGAAMGQMVWAIGFGL